MVAILVPIAGIVFTFMSLTIVLYVYFTTRNKERLALIARNQDASVFKSRRSKGKSYLRFGVLMIFFGIGAIVGISLVNLGIISEELAVLGICPIFIGFGMIVAHKMIEDKEEEDLEV